MSFLRKGGAKGTPEFILSVKRSVFRKDDNIDAQELADEGFKKARPLALDRDNNTCVFCGFSSPKWQEVRHLDNNHSNNDLKNLRTTCALCHQIFHLGFAGMRKSGLVVYMPEISQVDLNNIVRTIWIGISSKQEPWAEVGNEIYDSFKSRVNDTDKILKKYFSNFETKPSDPLTIANALSVMDDKDYNNRINLVRDLRLLPLPQPFMSQIEFWKLHNSKFIPPKTWGNIHKKIKEKINKSNRKS